MIVHMRRTPVILYTLLNQSQFWVQAQTDLRSDGGWHTSSVLVLIGIEWSSGVMVRQLEEHFSCCCRARNWYSFSVWEVLIEPASTLTQRLLMTIHNVDAFEVILFACSGGDWR